MCGGFFRHGSLDPINDPNDTKTGPRLSNLASSYPRLPKTLPCPHRKLDSSVAIVEASDDGLSNDMTDPFDRATNRCALPEGYLLNVLASRLMDRPERKEVSMIHLYYWPTPNGKKVMILLEECGLE